MPISSRQTARDTWSSRVGRDRQPLAGDPEVAGQEVPGVVDGLALEVVAEAPVAEHLEEGVVARRAADLLEVVVLAGDAQAALVVDGARVGTRLGAGEDLLELDHAGVREQQGRVARGDEARAGDRRVAALGEELHEPPPDLGGRQGGDPRIWSLGRVTASLAMVPKAPHAERCGQRRPRRPPGIRRVGSGRDASADARHGSHRGAAIRRRPAPDCRPDDGVRLGRRARSRTDSRGAIALARRAEHREDAHDARCRPRPRAMAAQQAEVADQDDRDAEAVAERVARPRAQDGRADQRAGGGRRPCRGSARRARRRRSRPGRRG